MSKDLDRRSFLLGAGAAVASSLVGGPRAQALRVAVPPPVDPLAPVLYVSHGGPNLAVSRVRGSELRAWGEGIAKPRGIVSVTPHYRARGIEIGAVGPGSGARSFPSRFAQATRGIDYRTPDNSALAARVSELLESRGEVRHSVRTANDHTTWMPLLHLFPDADVPVLEVALPFAPDAKVFSLGQALAPLRAEGVVIHCSGQMTHNLAALGRPGPPVPWAVAFDAWVEARIAERDYQALIDWRRTGPLPRPPRRRWTLRRTPRRPRRRRSHATPIGRVSGHRLRAQRPLQALHRAALIAAPAVCAPARRQEGRD